MALNHQLSVKQWCLWHVKNKTQTSRASFSREKVWLKITGIWMIRPSQYYHYIYNFNAHNNWSWSILLDNFSWSIQVGRVYPCPGRTDISASRYKIPGWHINTAPWSVCANCANLLSAVLKAIISVIASLVSVIVAQFLWLDWTKRSLTFQYSNLEFGLAFQQGLIF